MYVDSVRAWDQWLTLSIFLNYAEDYENWRKTGAVIQDMKISDAFKLLLAAMGS